MRLQSKTLLLLAPSVVLPMILLGWLGYGKLQDFSRQQTLAQADSALGQVELHLRAHLTTAKANVELFANDAMLTHYLLTNDEGERYALLYTPLLERLGSYQKAYPQYYEIRVVLPNGFEDVRSTIHGTPNASEDERESPFFRAIHDARADVYAAFVRNPDNQKLSLLVSKRLKFKDRAVAALSAPRSLRGYLIITSALDFLKDLERLQRIGRHGRVFFTDAQGRPLFNDAGRGSNAGGSGKHEVSAELVDQVAASGRGESVEVAGSAGMPTLIGRRLAGNLYAFAALPGEEYLLASRKMGRLVAQHTVVIMLVGSLLLFVVMRVQVLEPIQKLREATDRIQKGDWQLTLDTGSKDEFGELATSFQAMSNSLRQSSDRIQYLANHDSLTNLPNRRMLVEYLSGAIERSRRYDRTLAVLYLDLDDFKIINDSLGHPAGDTILREFAVRLCNCVRSADYLVRSSEVRGDPTVARLGGDEFVVVLSEIKDACSATVVAERILDSLKAPFRVQNRDLHLTGCIGIACYPGDGADSNMLLRHADLAMYAAKSSGKGHYELYGAHMNDSADQRLALANELHGALDRNELSLHYQSQVDASTSRLTGFEALVRWNHAEFGAVPPAQFIPIAEEIGLIGPVGEWVLREACRQAKAWQEAGYPAVPVAVNISSLQLKNSQFDRVVEDALASVNLSPHLLELELTESCITTADPRTLDMLARLRKHGVRLAMDDFGTGYSSLGALRQLPVDTLKIDRSFVCDISKDEADAAIVAVIISMAKILNIDVVAEGAEHKDQWRFLREQGCGSIQGYLISKPLPADGMEWLLRRAADWRPRSLVVTTPPDDVDGWLVPAP